MPMVLMMSPMANSPKKYKNIYIYEIKIKKLRIMHSTINSSKAQARIMQITAETKHGETKIKS
jgi:hypothetical protein